LAALPGGPIEGAKPSEAGIIREAVIREKSAVENFVAAQAGETGEANTAAAAGEGGSEGETEQEEKEEEPSHPHEVGPRIAFIGAHLLAWDCTSTMNRFALSLIAVTALLAAICGWRYDCATAFANGCAARAMEQQVAAFKNLEHGQTLIHYIWGIDAQMHEARLRYKAAEQRMELARDKSMNVTADREPSQMEWQKALLTQNKYAVEELDGDSGPEADPYYPQKQAELGGRQVSETAFAKWDAENELRQSWHLKAAQYLLTLTMFAIALYLLGQSMGMGLGRGAFILVLGGSLIGGVGAFCALKTAVHHLPRDAKELDGAAEAYGEGRGMYVMAHNSQDYAQAAEKFEAALKIRPTFALAHYYRGESLFNSARVHPDEPDSLPSRKSGVLAQTVREMTISLKDFNREGLAAPEELVGRYGFFTLLQALSPPDPALLKKGTDTLQDGIKAYPGDAWLESNLAVAQLISGQTDEARKAYDKVFAYGASPELAVAALGDLEIARRYCDSFPQANCATIKAEIDKLKPRLAAAAGPEPKDAHWETSHPSLSAPQISVSPAVVKWTAVVDADSDKDVLLVIWYWKDPDWGAWRVISSVSKKVRWDRVVDEGGNRKSLTLSYLDATWDHRCLPGGDFRAEFYLNGKMVAEESKSLALDHEFKAVGLHDINFEACYPSTWSGWTYRPTDVTGPELVRGSTSADRKRSVYLFSFFYPRIPNQDSTILEHAVGRASKIMEEHGLPRDLSFTRIAEPCGAYPLDNLSKNATWYQDSTRVATARAWIAGDGIVYVAMSANGARNGVDTDDCLVLTSLSNIYAPARHPAADSTAANSADGSDNAPSPTDSATAARE
jgi:tetratricopeptide (TPR) repeat protein